MANDVLGSAAIETTVDLDGLDKGIDNAEKKAKGGFAKIGDVIKGALSIGVAAGAGLLAGGIAALAGGVSDAREAAKVMAQTQATITSTGGAAGKSAKEIADYAASLSAASGNSLFGDDQIQNAQNLLLTFTNIKGAAFDAATSIATDMAQALGTEPQAQAMALGKALNDPIAGVAALGRVGVTFNDQQKEQIKTMQEAGDMAGAQGVILAELNKEFGGSAKAAADADGGMAQLNDRWGEMMETLGGMVLPILNQVVAFLNTSVMPAIESMASAFGDTGGGASQLAATWNTLYNEVLLPVFTQLQAWFSVAIPAAIATLTTYWNTVLLPILSALYALWQSQIQPALTELAGWFMDRLPGAIATLVGLWNGTLLPAIQAVAAFIADPVIPLIGQLVAWLRENLPLAIQAASDFFTNVLLPALNAIWAFINDPLIPILSVIAEWIGRTLPPLIQSLASFFTNTLLPALNAIWAFISNNVIPILTALANVAIALVKKEIELLAALWTNVLMPAFKDIGDFITGTIVPAITTLANTIGTILRPAIDGMSGPLSGIAKWFGDIGNAVKDVITFLGELADAISSIDIPSWLQGHSPPPLADWFSYIADSADRVTSSLPSFSGMGISGVAPSAPTASTAASGSVEVSLNDSGLGWLRNLIQVETTGIMNDSARSASSRRLT